MKTSRLHGTTSPARRGQIIQRVIVDGWTSAEIAAACGLSKHLVDSWVEDFRRNGMASLHERCGRGLAAENVELPVWRSPRINLWRIAAGLRRFLAAEPQIKPLPLHRLHRDGPR
jgi:hypothetical protein